LKPDTGVNAKKSQLPLINSNGSLVPEAPIAGADINVCYLEAAIKIRTSNAYFVPFADLR
jgi:hypothetical protein